MGGRVQQMPVHDTVMISGASQGPQDTMTAGTGPSNALPFHSIFPVSGEGVLSFFSTFDYCGLEKLKVSSL